MNGLQVFKNNEFSIKSVVINEEPWFIGKDIAHILGYANANDALIKHVDQDDKKTIQKSQNAILENIPNRGLTIINESGLYSLILSSKLESAKRFKRWVTSEVLPTLRKTGQYQVKELSGQELMAKALIEAQSVLAAKDKQIEQMKPKALFADAVTASETSILVRDFAKILKQNGVDIGEKRLYKWLRDNGFIIKNSTEPTQRAMEMGLFERIERTIQRSDKPPVVTSTTRITGKGQVYFTGKFLTEK